MDTITIDLKLLKSLRININEYLTLLKIHLIEKGDPVFFPFSSSEKVVRSLADTKWVVFDEDEEHGVINVKFTEKAARLFTQEDLFQEFHELFPVRIPNGTGGFRPVSAANLDAKSAQTARHLWIKTIGDNADTQRLVIECLRKELAHREQQGSLQYLNNIHTWLRQAKWEDWIDVPDVPDNNSNLKQL